MFKLKGRANELKTPKIPKISLPDSDTSSFSKNATPPPTSLLRRFSTTTNATTKGDTSTAPAGRPALPPPKSCLPVARASSTTQTQSSVLRGGPSQKPNRVSSVPTKAQNEHSPPKKGDGQVLTRPSAMSRKNSEAGGGPSKAIPRKAVNFVIDSQETRQLGDGYATDSPHSATWTRPMPSLRGLPASGKTDLPRSVSRREIREGESSMGEDPTAAWALNVTVGAVMAPAPRQPQSALRASFDGYATDLEPRPRRTSTSRTHTRGSSLPIPQPSIREESAHEQKETSIKGVPTAYRTNIPRFRPARNEERPPGLHSQLLADASGMPPLRFNVKFPPANPYVKTWDDIPRIICDEDLDESATETDLKTMSLQLNCEPLPSWECVVRKRKAISCRDVFEAIWREYDVELTETERSKIPEQYMSFYQKAFKKRCKEVPVLTALEESRGLKRVDLLAGKTFFRGMTKPDPSAPWVVELQIAPRGYTT